MTALPLMPFVAAALLAVPVRLRPRALAWLAFALWALGGAVLCMRGGARLLTARDDGWSPTSVVVGAAIALALGLAKGVLVLGRTARRNLERLAALDGPRRPVHVYGARSWIVIAAMTALSIALGLGRVPPFWRGLVNLAIGAGLLASSTVYPRRLAAAPRTV